ncbi:GNAT family N-acetyltransferase [Paenibacillus caui]|uniref:GNAT family N-acetyltransferase n=1 Tax=Paenibacillus caui TaxID=2873927 RepID=UPI001CA89CA9|nr:GNAT family N-acetyltransferase [Paenibacillus caui]
METERLYLREYEPEDFTALHDIFSDPETMRFYPSAFTPDQTRKWIARNQERYMADGFGLWAVCLKETGQLIGDSGLIRQNINGKVEVEIGYHLDKREWGKGYATEAAAGCKRYAFDFLKLNKVVSIIDPGNRSSIKVAERTGLKLERQERIFNKMHSIYALENSAESVS